MDMGTSASASCQGSYSGPSVAAFRSIIEHTSCTCEGGACSSGIAQQTSQAEGIEVLCRAVALEPEPLVTLTLLLRLCRDVLARASMRWCHWLESGYWTGARTSVATHPQPEKGDRR